MTRALVLFFCLTATPVAFAIDLMGNPDRCRLQRIEADPCLGQLLARPDVSRVMCWHQDVKLLTAASVLTKLIRARTALFVDGTGTLDLSIAALTGYRLESIVRFWMGDKVYVAMLVAKPDANDPDLLSQVYEVSPNHFFASR